MPNFRRSCRVNARVPASPASNREERESSSSSSSQPRSFDDTPIRPNKSSVPAPRKEPSPENVPIRAVKRQPAMAAGAAANSRIPAPSSHRHSNNNHADDEEEADALDALSRRFPKKKAPPPSPQPDDFEPAPLEPGTASHTYNLRLLAWACALSAIVSRRAPGWIAGLTQSMIPCSEK